MGKQFNRGAAGLGIWAGRGWAGPGRVINVFSSDAGSSRSAVRIEWHLGSRSAVRIEWRFSSWAVKIEGSARLPGSSRLTGKHA